MENLRHLPSIHVLQAHPTFQQFQIREKMSEKMLTKQVQRAVDSIRDQLLKGNIKDPISRKLLTNMVFQTLDKILLSRRMNILQPVINATGVVLHTNLGRARLSDQATNQLMNIASSYSTLEYNLATNKRGSRHDIVEDYLTELTGAEAAMVVNNNAAAVYLVLKALAEHQEVIDSWGEHVEIGGSFRISEIMAESGAHLVDVGTTNKTKLADYETAVTYETALLMKVHKSNFALIGFTEEVTTEELLAIAQHYELPIYEDLGSGTLYDFKEKNIGSEPTVQEKVQSGIDIISFSGDKLLGGPQAGIIVGKEKYISKLKKHQLARVLRVDKLTLASLEATLKSYLRGKVEQEIPTLIDILKDPKTIKEKAERFSEHIHKLTTGFQLTIKKDVSQVGGGTMPGVQLDTYVVLVSHQVYDSQA